LGFYYSQGRKQAGNPTRRVFDPADSAASIPTQILDLPFLGCFDAISNR